MSDDKRPDLDSPAAQRIFLAASRPYLERTRERALAATESDAPLTEEEWTRLLSDASHRPQLRGRLARWIDEVRHLARSETKRQGGQLVPSPNLAVMSKCHDQVMRLAGLEAPRETKLEVTGARSPEWDALTPDEQSKRIEDAEERIRLLKAAVPK